MYQNFQKKTKFEIFQNFKFAMLIFLVLKFASSYNLRKKNIMKVSSKVSYIKITGSGNLIAIGEISNSLSSYPPKLNIYKINEKGELKFIFDGKSISSSLGKSIVNIKNGFVVSSPQASFFWGEMGSVLSVIKPPQQYNKKIYTPFIRYGETLAASNDGDLILGCDPVLSKNCVVIKNNITSFIEKKNNYEFFGLGVAINPKGDTMVILSMYSGDEYVVSIYSIDNVMIGEIRLPIENSISLRKKCHVEFVSDSVFVVYIESESKMFRFSYDKNMWVYDTSKSGVGLSIKRYDDVFVTVNQAGKVVFRNQNLQEIQSMNIPNDTDQSKFTNIAAGNKWIAFLEESKNRRLLHIYTVHTIRDLLPYLLMILAASFSLIMLILFKPKFITLRTITRAISRPDVKEV